VMETRPKC